ncbi:MAG: hypothetical protein ACI88H_000726 [Cocleimonas sp.]|jgi:hypothetical protein
MKVLTQTPLSSDVKEMSTGNGVLEASPISAIGFACHSLSASS